MMMTYEPTDAELEILQCIWALEPVGVRSVYDRISMTKKVGYTTVLKQIQRLTEKGVLEKEDQNGTHLYRSKVDAQQVKMDLASKVLQTAFGGSALQMMMHAVGNDNTTSEELEALQVWIAQLTEKSEKL